MGFDSITAADDWLDEFLRDPCPFCGRHDDEYHWARAAGNAVCELCGRDFNRHPMDKTHVGFDGHPWLHRLCDGRLVKT